MWARGIVIIPFFPIQQSNDLPKAAFTQRVLGVVLIQFHTDRGCLTCLSVYVLLFRTTLSQAGLLDNHFQYETFSALR